MKNCKECCFLQKRDIDNGYLNKNKDQYYHCIAVENLESSAIENFYSKEIEEENNCFCFVNRKEI